jgi:hypothetical protein
MSKIVDRKMQIKVKNLEVNLMWISLFSAAKEMPQKITLFSTTRG